MLRAGRQCLLSAISGHHTGDSVGRLCAKADIMSARRGPPELSIYNRPRAEPDTARLSLRAYLKCSDVALRPLRTTHTALIGCRWWASVSNPISGWTACLQGMSRRLARRIELQWSEQRVCAVEISDRSEKRRAGLIAAEITASRIERPILHRTIAPAYGVCQDRVL
jgi:hypothetical protein